MIKNISNPINFLNAIHKKINYLLIGRRAVIIYGGPVQTMDYDIYIDSEKKNIDNLLKISKEFGLHPSIKAENIYKTFKFKLENDFVIDVFTFKYFIDSKGNKISFFDIFNRKKVAKDKSGFEVYVPHIDDLIELKKIRKSLKDLEDIKYLEKIKELD